jgi:hypothetical protein
MTQYIVGSETYYNVSAAKKEMKRTGLPGYKYKIYSDGEWVPCGEIVLKGSNKTFIANSPRNMKQANY